MQLCKLRFENKEDAQLTQACLDEVFRESEWSLVEPSESSVNTVEKRLATAILPEEDAVAFGGSLFYGHVLVSQERAINFERKIIGTSINIAPMDDAKFKPVPGRSGYYGTGIHKLGVCPTA
jgi:hypothetical protein